MGLGGIAVGRRGATRLDALLDAARERSVTYDHVGSTLTAQAVDGIEDRTFARDAHGSLAAARAALVRWAPQGGVGGRVHPPSVAPTEGDSVLVVVPFGPVELLAPDRIVAVVDEGDRFGVAYGTLPGHALTGEELFLAERVGPGRLRLTVRIHSRPATALTRMATPIVERLQRAAAHRYLRAWADAVADHDS